MYIASEVTGQDMKDVLQLSRFIDWLADCQFGQKVLDQWPKPESGSRLAAHWDQRWPGWQRYFKVPAFTSNGNRINDTRFYEALFDACIDQSYAALADTVSLRRQAKTAKSFLTPMARDIMNITPATTAKAQLNMLWNWRPPKYYNAHFAPEADVIRHRFGDSLFGGHPSLSPRNISHVTMCHIANGRHPMDMDTFGLGKLIFVDNDMAMLNLAYAGYPPYLVWLRIADIV